MKVVTDIKGTDYNVLVLESAEELDQLQSDIDDWNIVYYDINNRYLAIISGGDLVVVYGDGLFKTRESYRKFDEIVAIDTHSQFGKDWVNILDLENI